MGSPLITKSEQPISVGKIYKEIIHYLNGPASYTTGGDTLTARDLGLSSILYVEFLCISADRIAHPVFVANDTPESSIKMLITDLAGTQVASTSDQSAKKFRCKVRGYY